MEPIAISSLANNHDESKGSSNVVPFKQHMRCNLSDCSKPLDYHNTDYLILENNWVLSKIKE